MPLDTGAITDDMFASATLDAGRSPPRPLGVREGEHIGQVLRSARDGLGLSLDEVSERTAVKTSYLRAIESMRMDQLPSRPFVIGFIRAFAEVVGVEPDLAVARYKSDNPERSQPLRNPLGIDIKRDSRARVVIIVGVVVFTAILAWNIVQRVLSGATPPPPAVAETAATRAPATPISSQNPVALGAPTPPPPEATTPEPYSTPGMDRVMQEARGEAASPAAPPAPAGRPGTVAPGVVPADAPATFQAKGKVYGAPANASLVTLQARKSGLVILHAAGGAVVALQALQAGEAYRIPNNPALSLDVSDPAVFDVYVAGQIHASLTGQVTALGKISAPAAPTTHAVSTPH